MINLTAMDVYDNSPTIITTWLSIMPKISILILLLNLQIGIGISIFQFIYSSDQLLNTQVLFLNTNFNSFILNDLLLEINSYNIITNFLLICSLLSLLIGTIVGLSQTRIKRLLAFSTISHIGFLLLALAINNEQSIESLIFYLIQYSLTNFNIFLVILAVGYTFDKFKNKKNENHSNSNNKINLIQSNVELDVELIANFKGLFFKNPLLSLSFALSLFSFAGS